MASNQRDDPNTKEIINKVSEYLKKDPNKWLATTKFLVIEDKTITARYLEVLRSVFTNDVAFNKIVDKLAEDAQILENDPSYISYMTDTWKKCLLPNENRNVETAANKGWVFQKLVNLVIGADALENAYKFLGLDCGASNDEINSIFWQLALKYHPYKGGSDEYWNKLQVAMGFIKLSKGEF